MPFSRRKFDSMPGTAAARAENWFSKAAGPDPFPLIGLFGLTAGVLGRRIRLLHTGPAVTLFLVRLLGLAVRDVILTREEIEGLRANLLVSSQPPLGRTQLSAWLEQNAARAGARYASELGRHFR